jgi:hypothetical protein
MQHKDAGSAKNFLYPISPAPLLLRSSASKKSIQPNKKATGTNQWLSMSERLTGLEPVTTAWEAGMLPLHHSRLRTAELYPNTAVRQPLAGVRQGFSKVVRQVEKQSVH